MTMNDLKRGPSPAQLFELVRLRHGGDPDHYGWATRMRLRFGYFTPDEVYEATVAQLVTTGCAWLEVGCGRDIFPNNRALARSLADRCATLVGVDPDPTIEGNPFLHQRVRCPLDEFQSSQPFDVVTMRMVAEHIIDPESAVVALARLIKPGSQVVVYTVNRWSPVSLLSLAIPFRFHHPIKHALWKTEEKDTFPIAYRMNTRRQLRRLFEEHGFREASFAYLDDCRTFANTRPLHFLELSLRRLLRSIGLRYPENCLLGIYELMGPAEPLTQ
jgi:SAM-dependent methyltransferase